MKKILVASSSRDSIFFEIPSDAASPPVRAFAKIYSIHSLQ